MTIIDRIKVLCAQHGTSIPKLEKELGFGNGAIYNWSTSSPSVDKAQKVAEYFGTTVDYLLGGEKVPGNTSTGYHIPESAVTIEASRSTSPWPILKTAEWTRANSSRNCKAINLNASEAVAVSDILGAVKGCTVNDAMRLLDSAKDVILECTEIHSKYPIK